MRQAGAFEQIPVCRRDRPLVADRQRDQHAGPRPRRHFGLRVVMHQRREARTHRVALRVDPCGEAARPFGDQPLRLSSFAAGTHMAGRADAALEQPGFVVEAVRVHVAVRPLEAHPQLPAAAGLQRRRRSRCRRIRVATVVPGEGDAPWHAGRRLLDRKIEALAALHPLRQPRDHANQVDVPPFEGVR